MATLGTIRNVVSRKIGLNNTAGSSDQIMVDEWVNQAVEHILLRTHCRVLCSSMETTANIWKYELPAAILAIKDVWTTSTDQYGPLERWDPDTLLTYRQSNPQGANSLRYAVMGSNLLLLYPTPTEAFEIDVFYVPKPGTATSETDNFSTNSFGIPTEFHKAIELFTLWQAADFVDDQSSQRGESYRAQFEDFLGRTVLPAINRKGGNTGRVRTRRYPVISRRNDVYP